MRCYVHAELEARGICSICGRGVCEQCESEVGNRLTCGSRECRSQARTMRGLTIASRPEVIYGAMGLLLLAFGIAGALAIDDPIMLLVAALGAVFVAMAFIARR